MSDATNEVVRAIGDTASVATVVGTLSGYMPSLAALFTIIWTAIRIYETDTVQGWIKRRKDWGA
jgi:hypothetical protein